MFLNCHIRHPWFLSHLKDWDRWRRAYEGGRQFINEHLVQYSAREDNPSFEKRRQITYCPRFAGAAIDDVKNSIYQRMGDITRAGGPSSYVRALREGVDLKGRTMDFFIGQEILLELLITAKVGVHVDAPANVGETQYESSKATPYLIPYYTDDILNWNDDCSSLLLQNLCEECDPHTGLTKQKHKKTFRYFRLVSTGVEVYDVTNLSTKHSDLDIQPSYFLDGFTRIPFVTFELPKSLMEDICDYQIALMNLDSADLAYLLHAAAPFYVEEFDPRFENIYAKTGEATGADGEVVANPTNAVQIAVGATNGRRYAKGTQPPQFIHPSTEPLTASMSKQEQIKVEIRHLLNLTLSNTAPKFASAESKNMDQRSLEAGLAAIGEILEQGEREIGEIWAMYDKTGPAPTINYPRSYSLKSDGERREEAKTDKELIGAAPSRTYQKEVSKRIATTMLGHVVSYETLKKIHSEIDAAKYITSDAEAIKTDHEGGLVSDKTASVARGYGPDEHEQAKKDRAERIKLTQMAQTPAEGNLENPGARGVKDLQTDPKDAVKEKEAVNAATS